jgi:hypothetical protein
MREFIGLSRPKMWQPSSCGTAPRNSSNDIEAAQSFTMPKGGTHGTWLLTPDYSSRGIFVLYDYLQLSGRGWRPIHFEWKGTLIMNQRHRVFRISWAPVTGSLCDKLDSIRQAVQTGASNDPWNRRSCWFIPNRVPSFWYYVRSYLWTINDDQDIHGTLTWSSDHWFHKGCDH